MEHQGSLVIFKSCFACIEQMLSNLLLSTCCVFDAKLSQMYDCSLALVWQNLDCKASEYHVLLVVSVF